MLDQMIACSRTPSGTSYVRRGDPEEPRTALKNLTIPTASGGLRARRSGALRGGGGSGSS